MRPRSAQVLCHKSVPLGPSLQMGMCMPVWATLTHLAPLLKPAELDGLGHWGSVVLWNGNLQERSGRNQVWGGKIARCPGACWGSNGGQSQPLPESQWMEVSLLSENLRVWTISDPWLAALRSMVTSDWAKASGEEAMACSGDVKPQLRLISRPGLWHCGTQHTFPPGKMNWCAALVYLLGWV